MSGLLTSARLSACTGRRCFGLIRSFIAFRCTGDCCCLPRILHTTHRSPSPGNSPNIAQHRLSTIRKLPSRRLSAAHTHHQLTGGLSVCSATRFLELIYDGVCYVCGSYEEGDRDHVSHSLNFFVNFLAIFRRMLEVRTNVDTLCAASVRGRGRPIDCFFCFRVPVWYRWSGWATATEVRAGEQVVAYCP